MKVSLKLNSEIRWILAGQVLAFLASFVGLKVLSNQLGTLNYGKLGLGLSISSLVNSFIYGPLSNSFLRFLSEYRSQNKLSFFLKESLKINILVTLVFLPILAVAIVLAVFKAGFDPDVLVFGVLHGIVSGFQNGLFSELMALRERKLAALNQAGLFWLRQIFAFLFCVMFAKNMQSALVGYIISDAAIFWTQYLFLKKKFYRDGDSQKPTKENVKSLSNDLLFYSLPFSVSALLNTVNTTGDRWLVEWLFSTDQVGVYYAISQISNTPTILAGAIISQLISPIAYERASEDLSGNPRKRSAEKVAVKAAIATLLICGILPLAIWPISTFVVKLLSTPEAAAHAGILPLLLLSSGIFQTGSIMMLIGQIYKNNWPYLSCLFLKGFSLVFLSCVLRKKNGLAGIGYAQMISSLFYLTAVVLVNRFITKKLN